MIQPILDSLEGKKTFITAGLTLAFAVLGLMLGHLDGTQFTELLLAAMALVGLRDAINSKQGK